MRLFILLAAGALAGCSGSRGEVYPVDSTSAVREFLNAARSNDLPAMGMLWGNSRGPAARRMDSDVLEQRLTVIRTYLRHDSYEVVGERSEDVTGSSGARRIVEVRLRRDGCRPVVPFTVVRYRDGWLVENIDLTAAGNPAMPCPPSDGS